MWGKPTLFHREKSIDKNVEKSQTFTQSIEKIFFIDLLNTNNAICATKMLRKAKH